VWGETHAHKTASLPPSQASSQQQHQKKQHDHDSAGLARQLLKQATTFLLFTHSPIGCPPFAFASTRMHKPHNSTHGAPAHHRRARGRCQLGRRARHRPPRGMGPRPENGDGLVDAWRLMSVCTASREGAKEWLGTRYTTGLSARREGGLVCVRRVFFGWASERRVEARPGDAAVGAHACSRDRSLQPRVLRGERHPRRSRWKNVRRRRQADLLGSGDAFSGAFVDLPPLS
jgi:hypothetical protein